MPALPRSRGRPCAELAVARASFARWLPPACARTSSAAAHAQIRTMLRVLRPAPSSVGS